MHEMTPVYLAIPLIVLIAWLARSAVRLTVKNGKAVDNDAS